MEGFIENREIGLKATSKNELKEVRKVERKLELMKG